MAFLWPALPCCSICDSDSAVCITENLWVLAGGFRFSFCRTLWQVWVKLAEDHSSMRCYLHDRLYAGTKQNMQWIWKLRPWRWRPWGILSFHRAETGEMNCSCSLVRPVLEDPKLKAVCLSLVASCCHFAFQWIGVVFCCFGKNDAHSHMSWLFWFNGNLGSPAEFCFKNLKFKSKCPFEGQVTAFAF